MVTLLKSWGLFKTVFIIWPRGELSGDCFIIHPLYKSDLSFEYELAANTCSTDLPRLDGHETKTRVRWLYSNVTWPNLTYWQTRYTIRRSEFCSRRSRKLIQCALGISSKSMQDAIDALDLDATHARDHLLGAIKAESSRRAARGPTNS